MLHMNNTNCLQKLSEKKKRTEERTDQQTQRHIYLFIYPSFLFFCLPYHIVEKNAGNKNEEIKIGDS